MVIILKVPIINDQYFRWLFEIRDELILVNCGVVVHKECLYARNCLLLLAGIADDFPKVSEYSSRIGECIAELTKSYLETVRLSFSRFLGRLSSAKVKRIPEFIFRLKNSQ